MQKKIGFWSVLSLVIGSQIGSGVLVAPSTLAPYGLYSILGWTLSGIMAVTLAMIFGKLCMMFPKTGGPHVYAGQAFGRTFSFFTGWAYWVVSWFSTPVVIIAAVNYLSTIMPIAHPLYWQLGLLAAITLLNLKSVQSAGRVEFFLSLFKFLPLVIIPMVALCYFQIENVQTTVTMTPTSLAKMVMISLFSFLGLESATAPAEFVDKPQKTIPRAIVIGTITVALIYILNSAGILGLISSQQLMNSNAPYVEATQKLFGSFSKIMGSIAVFVCIGSLNAWVLTSAQIAYGLAKDRLFPAVFAQKNKNGTPYMSVLISSLLVVPLLVMTAHRSIADQLTLIMEYSSIMILFVYAIAALSLVKVSKYKILGAIGFLFCVSVLPFKPFSEIFIGGLFIAAGIPMYYLMRQS